MSIATTLATMQSSLVLGEVLTIPTPPPVCFGQGAKIVEKFRGEAHGANIFYASDETAEAVIRDLYQKASEDLSKLSKDDRYECDRALSDVGNDAIWYGDSGLEILYGHGVDDKNDLGPIIGTLVVLSTLGFAPIMFNAVYASDIR
ncbi:MAG: hypothetical protein HYT75_08605 [Deltaproteobacteria bacterium]|nr:hypothetical protein [Deltaproteobacteria bacterium]MBI2341122.1 hypothetical protein [Deltaproteobacteria bacterium]